MANIEYTREFYIAITKLFYAFSMVDRSMSIEEKKEIVWSVKDDWATNEYGFNSEELIYETMRHLIKEKFSADKAYEDFKDFFNNNLNLFNNQTNELLKEACNKICYALNGRNKSELILLTKLYRLMGDLDTTNLN